MGDPTDPASKRSTERLRRLRAMLDTKLTDPTLGLEILVAEVEAGDGHDDLWERLHGAAVRDDKEFELAAAYEQIARGRRLKPLSPEAQGQTLMRAADFLGGVLGDADASVVYLERVLAVNPEHAEAFARLERRYSAARDNRHMAELLITVIAGKHENQVLRIGNALMLISILPADQAVSYEACERLVRAGTKNPRVLIVLEEHCRRGQRFKEAAALLELGLQVGEVTPALALDVRRRLVALYMDDAKSPESAIEHVEELLRADPANVNMRKAAERLLVHTSVAGRAAAALQDARRHVPHPS
jgi:hypothetical protein